MPHKDPEVRKEYGRKYWRKNKERYKINARIWYKNNPEKTKAMGKRYRDRHPDVMKNKALRRYGITLEHYQKMLKEQNSGCKICKRTQEGKALAVDHCHKTGKVRGLLCQHCNLGMGHFEDSLELLQSAIAYLSQI